MNQKMSRRQVAVAIGLAAVVIACLIPGSGAALPLSGNGGFTVSSVVSSPFSGSASLFAGYSLPKSPLLSEGYGLTILNSGIGSTSPGLSGQTGTNGAPIATAGSTQMAGLFSSALRNYYRNPPPPITNASPSEFLVATPGSDQSWDALFSHPVYYGCGCG